MLSCIAFNILSVRKTFYDRFDSCISSITSTWHLLQSLSFSPKHSSSCMYMLLHPDFSIMSSMSTSTFVDTVFEPRCSFAPGFCTPLISTSLQKSSYGSFMTETVAILVDRSDPLKNCYMCCCTNTVAVTMHRTTFVPFYRTFCPTNNSQFYSVLRFKLVPTE